MEDNFLRLVDEVIARDAARDAAAKQKAAPPTQPLRKAAPPVFFKPAPPRRDYGRELDGILEKGMSLLRSGKGTAHDVIRLEMLVESIRHDGIRMGKI